MLHEIGLFLETESDGIVRLIGTIGGVPVVLVKNGRLVDELDRPFWQLYVRERDRRGVHRGRRVEMLDGGCTLHSIEPMPEPEKPKSRPRRRRKGGAA